MGMLYEYEFNDDKSKVIRNIVSKRERINDLYSIGPVQKAAVEDFVDDIIKECGVALNTMLRDMISRGQAYEILKQHFGTE